MRTKWDLHLILPQPRKTTRTLLRYLKAANFSDRPCRQLNFFSIHVDCAYSCIYALFLSFSLPSPLQVQGSQKTACQVYLLVLFIKWKLPLVGAFAIFSLDAIHFHLMDCPVPILASYYRLSLFPGSLGRVVKQRGVVCAF